MKFRTERLHVVFCAPRVAAFFLSLAFFGCFGERPPPGRIVVKNDSLDSSYNVITVSGGGMLGSLKPGERMVMPAGTRTFSVERRYKEYIRSYSVVCPALGDKGVFVKLIDIHVNRIAGGCKTTYASKH
jgi:hypothetical protein